MSADCDLDLTALTELTGGNPGVENALFELFIRNANDAVEGLRAAHGEKNNAGWRMHAHYLKGAASNLGAATLSFLCAQAEAMAGADRDALASMLRDIEAESTAICSLLERRMTGSTIPPDTSQAST